MKLKWEDVMDKMSMAQLPPFTLKAYDWQWEIEMGPYAGISLLSSSAEGGNLGTRDKSKAAAEAALREMLLGLKDFALEGGTG